MTRLLASFARGSSAAAITLPFTTLLCSAKDLTSAELANMAQASAVRIGCGISVGMPSVSEVGPIYSSVFMASFLTAVAIQCLTKEKRAAIWAILRRVSLVYYWCGVFICAGLILMPWLPLVNYLVALWFVSSIVAVPIMVCASFKAFYKMVQMIAVKFEACIKWMNQIGVRVDGNSVTLRQGLRQQTRIVNLTDDAGADEALEAKTQTEIEAEKCLTH